MTAEAKADVELKFRGTERRLMGSLLPMRLRLLCLRHGCCEVDTEVAGFTAVVMAANEAMESLDVTEARVENEYRIGAATTVLAGFGATVCATISA